MDGVRSAIRLRARALQREGVLVPWCLHGGGTVVGRCCCCGLGARNGLRWSGRRSQCASADGSI